MADVRFITENPFMRTWAEGDERDRKAAESAQMGDLRRQQIAASQQAIRASEETVRAAREQRDQAAAIDAAQGQAATAMANPLERVVARPVPDWNAAINLPETPAMATENTRETVRRELPNAAVITQLAGVKGGGKIALDMANAGRKAGLDAMAALAKADTPEAVDLYFRQARAAGEEIPDGVLTDRRKQAFIAAAVKQAHALGYKEAEAANVVREAMIRSGMFGMQETPPAAPKKDEISWYDPVRGAGITKSGQARVISGLPDRETGGRSGTGAEPKLVKADVKFHPEVNQQRDENTGAYAVWEPGKPETPGKSRWFSPDDPPTPATEGRWKWRMTDGTPINGPFDHPFYGGRGAGAAPSAGMSPAGAPPQAAIDFLRANPHTAEQFRQRTGADPAQYLGGARPAVPAPAPSAPPAATPSPTAPVQSGANAITDSQRQDIATARALREGLAATQGQMRRTRDPAELSRLTQQYGQQVQVLREYEARLKPFGITP